MTRESKSVDTFFIDGMADGGGMAAFRHLKHRPGTARPRVDVIIGMYQATGRGLTKPPGPPCEFRLLDMTPEQLRVIGQWFEQLARFYEPKKGRKK